MSKNPVMSNDFHKKKEVNFHETQFNIMKMNPIIKNSAGVKKCIYFVNKKLLNLFGVKVSTQRVA